MAVIPTVPSRPDISDKVIHFTRAATYGEAVDVLLKIADECRILGGTGMIKGGYRCVCFTEAPLVAVATAFVNAGSFLRYSPFGLIFEKSWVYARAGRPVIYQPDEDFYRLPDELRWKHVRYELTSTPPVDFTWEREWRIQCGKLLFNSGEVALVVPTEEWEAAIVSAWDGAQELVVEPYSTILDQLTLLQMQKACPWRVIRLAS
ncbi:MAG: hypothetical protein AABM64_10025 [Pseudomonadota bacterium]